MAKGCVPPLGAVAGAVVSVGGVVVGAGVSLGVVVVVVVVDRIVERVVLDRHVSRAIDVNQVFMGARELTIPYHDVMSPTPIVTTVELDPVPAAAA